MAPGKKPPDAAVDQQPKVLGWVVGWIAAAVFTGLLLGGGLLWLYRIACEGRTGGVCKMAVDSPPWLLFSGLIAAPAVLLTWYWRTVQKQADIWKGWQDISLATDAQFTDRFVRAVEMLGNPLEPVRLGGIYALQRLARDSVTDRSTIRETLAAFVRLTSTSDPPEELEVPGEDVRAVIKVLGASDLQGAEPANLESANLIEVPMRGCIFRNANLRYAGLFKANLMGADLEGADLEGANLNMADLQGANLANVNLQGAEIEGANFKGATIAKATLEKAKRGNKPIALTDDDFSAVLGGTLL
jgi:hypothetical protein